MSKRSKRRKKVDGPVFTPPVMKKEQPSSSSSGRGNDWLWGLILVLAVVLVYQPVWYAGFIWDDDEVVTSNPVIIGPLGLKEIWTTAAADICPLVITTVWLEHALWGLSPLPYHLVNVLMHGACAVALWRVLRSLEVPGAWLGAAFWALHPVEVESVAWITELKNTQSGLFFLLSILFFVKWLKAENSDGRNNRRWDYAWTLLFAVLAMASKSSSVILPLVLCLSAWWMEGRWQWRSQARVFPLFILSLAAGALSIWTQGLKMGIALDPHWHRTWPERLVVAGDAFWFYLLKLVWPYPLSIFYPRWQIDAGFLISYLPLLMLIAAMAVFWLWRDSWSRPWFFTFSYFLVALLPVLGFVNQIWFSNSYVADHMQYLASMGPLALAGAGVFWLGQSISSVGACLQPALAGFVLLVLGVVSWQRTGVFESLETLSADTLKKNPDCWVACNTLGVTLYEKGKVDEAMSQYEKALEINPNYAPANYNLGSALIKKGRVDEATARFQRAIDINPNYAEALADLGNIYLQKGDVDRAIKQYQKSLAITPYLAEVHNSLAVAYTRNGRIEEAVVQFQKALDLKPGYAKSHYNLGNAFMQTGRLDDAVTQFQKAVEINADFADAHAELGIALSQKGRLTEAIDQFQEVVRLRPNDGDAQSNLAQAQAMARQASGRK